jgi:hypothetical protein
MVRIGRCIYYVPRSGEISVGAFCVTQAAKLRPTSQWLCAQNADAEFETAHFYRIQRAVESAGDFFVRQLAEQGVFVRGNTETQKSRCPVTRRT